MSPSFTNGPSCVMFAGQSVQETGMGVELLKNAAARECLERLKPTLGPDLEYLLTKAPEEELALTFNAQRAIHASHVAHWCALRAAHPELEIDGAVGHSMGIVAALVAAEALTIEDSGTFIAARAKAFSDCCKSFSEPMGLAAVSSEDFKDVVESASEVPGVSVALWNTVGRGTLGGTMSALESYGAKAMAEDWPVKIKILKVEGPYHTSAFNPCLPALLAAASRLQLKIPRVPVYMGTSGKAESDPDTIRKLIVSQATACERHLEAVRASYSGGCRYYLEASFKPQPVTWLAEQLLDETGASLPGVSGLSVLTAELL